MNAKKALKNVIKASQKYRRALADGMDETDASDFREVLALVIEIDRNLVEAAKALDSLSRDEVKEIYPRQGSFKS